MNGRWMLALGLLVASGCTASSADEAALGATSREGRGESALVPIPAVTSDDHELTRGTLVSLPPTIGNIGGPAAAVIDADGQLGIVRGGHVSNTWFKFDAFASPDRSTAVLTLGPHIDGIGPERPMHWVSLPSGEDLGEQTMRSDAELTATSLDGTFAGFTTRAPEPVDGQIAGVRATSRIEIISRADGLVFERELDGNFVPEAFSGRLTAAGVPALVFLLEYFPADAPRFYRVRVLDTASGEVSLPLNLRNKQQQVDERMAGFTRSQVVAEEHGLLFTLYRGTIDGTPGGEPYAFVHTLDFADGVWCLDVDPALELEQVAGALAVGGDRLYVASANGRVGSFRIPSITDPNLAPTMEWVSDVAGATDGTPPLLTADHEGAYVNDPSRPGFLARVGRDGAPRTPTRMFGAAPTAFSWDDGALHAVGDEWATFGPLRRPDWLDEVEVLVVGG